MKIYNEDVNPVEGSTSLSKYLMQLKKAIGEETTAIQEYDEILKGSVPASAKAIIQEILDDEKDHLVLLTNLLQDELDEEMPDAGNEGMAIESTDDE